MDKPFTVPDWRGFEWQLSRHKSLSTNRRCTQPERLATEPAEGLTAEEFDGYAAIEQAAPAGAALEALAHACECNACGAGLIRKSVRVALKVGELEFSREYALD